VKNDAADRLSVVRDRPYRARQKEALTMIATFAGPVGSGVPSFAVPMGAVAGAMGALGMGLLLVTVLVLVTLSRRRTR